MNIYNQQTINIKNLYFESISPGQKSMLIILLRTKLGLKDNFCSWNDVKLSLYHPQSSLIAGHVALSGLLWFSHNWEATGLDSANGGLK